MIYSKANLEVHRVASTDPKTRALHGILLEEDGSTVAGKESMLLAIGPVEYQEKIVFPQKVGTKASLGPGGLVMPIESIVKALKNLPKSNVALQHTQLTRIEDQSRIGFTCLDSKGDPEINASKPKPHAYPDWKKTVRDVRGDGDVLRICINRKDLILLLQAMDAACPDKSGYSPVFIEVGEEEKGLVLRSKNYATKQNAIGVVRTLPVNTWPERGEWEYKVLGLSPRVARKKVVVRKKRRNE